MRELMSPPVPADKTFRLRVRGEIAVARARCFEILGVPDPRAPKRVKPLRPRSPRSTPLTVEQAHAAIRRWAREHDGKPPTIEDWKRRIDGYPNEKQVRQACGSWPDAIEDAGFPRPSRGRGYAHRRAALSQVG